MANARTRPSFPFLHSPFYIPFLYSFLSRVRRTMKTPIMMRFKLKNSNFWKFCRLIIENDQNEEVLILRWQFYFVLYSDYRYLLHPLHFPLIFIIFISFDRDIISTNEINNRTVFFFTSASKALNSRLFAANNFW